MRGRNSLIIIAAVAKNNVIGNNGTMPWNIPEERALFKKTTSGKNVIMGRKTFKSIGRALPGREMLVLSRSPLLTKERAGVRWCSSIQNALDKTKNERTVFVIGGSDLYAQMMPFVDQMFISHLKEAFAGDCYFPEINKNIWRAEEQQEFPDFIHIKYTRI